jgi:hypothetical protein
VSYKELRQLPTSQQDRGHSQCNPLMRHDCSAMGHSSTQHARIPKPESKLLLVRLAELAVDTTCYASCACRRIGVYLRPATAAVRPDAAGSKMVPEVDPEAGTSELTLLNSSQVKLVELPKRLT